MNLGLGAQDRSSHKRPANYTTHVLTVTLDYSLSQDVQSYSVHIKNIYLRPSSSVHGDVMVHSENTVEKQLTKR